MSLRNILLVLILALISDFREAVGQQFALRGRAVGRFRAGQSFDTRTASFEVRVDGGSWRIVVIPETPTSTVKYYETVYISGGKYRYSVAPYSNETIEKGQLEFQHADTRERFPAKVAWVEPHIVPQLSGLSPFTPVLWYAYCSNAYLKEADQGTYIQPPFLVDDEKHHIELGLTNVVATWTLFPEPPNLPRNIWFIHNGVRWSMYGPRKLESPFNQGYTNGVFAVKQTSLIANQRIPKRFGFKIYYPISNGAITSRHGTLFRDYQFEVSEAMWDGSDAFVSLPSLDGNAVITDVRFMNKNAPLMAISITTNRWLDDREVKATTAYERVSRRMSRIFPGGVTRSILDTGLAERPSQSGLKRLTIWGVPGTVIIIVALVAIRRIMQTYIK